jgi:poly-beta-1,6-N-acetyl-D-glucosamine synthase
MVRFAVVTPARNEALNLPRLADCLTRQSLPPVEWIVVDNGSTDETLALTRDLERNTPWLRVLAESGEALPTRGGPVAAAFMTGVRALEDEVDLVIKIDGDITFGDDYLERLVAEFAANPDLGIASGTCYELEDGEWVPRHVTAGRVRGASRAYRWDCLQDVLPLEDRKGWDGIDEQRAAASGWQTMSFAHLPFRHHRALGSRDASLVRTRVAHGRSAHYMGYRFTYLVARALFRARRDPSALAMIPGYVAAAASRATRLPDEQARAQLRRQQRLRVLPLRIREALGRSRP